MIARLGLFVSDVFRRIVPDPFVIAVLLLAFTILLALVAGDFPALGGEAASVSFVDSGVAVVDALRSSRGMWQFLAFSMQMCLVLVTGHILAESPLVKRLLRGLALLPRGGVSAAMLVAGIACCTAILNWGLGLIVGAILAREVGRALTLRGVRFHYPLLAAAGFTGLMVWHGGLSGSAPLSMTTLESARRVLPESTLTRLAEGGFPSGVGLESTTFSPLNLVITLGLLLIAPLAFAFLSPRSTDPVRDMRSAAPQMLLDPPASAVQSGERTLAEWLDRTPLVNLLLAVPLLLALWRFGVTSDLRRIGLDEINLTMLALGLILHGSPRDFLGAVDEAVKGCGGVIIQFPIYGAVVGVLVVSGLDATIANALADVATPDSLPLLTFLSAAVLNLFIPSGGGQWAVQGPIALETAMGLKAHPGPVILAVAYGDQLTNMLQPFWALPLLAITGVKARDIVGYTALVMLVGGVWIALMLWIF